MARKTVLIASVAYVPSRDGVFICGNTTNSIWVKGTVGRRGDSPKLWLRSELNRRLVMARKRTWVLA